MFISFSKAIGKVGGFRIGVGKRINSKNAWWMFLLYACVCCFQLMWYGVILAFWLMYAMFYGIYWCFKHLFKVGVKAGKVINEETKKSGETSDKPSNIATDSLERSENICPSCGNKLSVGNIFCTKCGYRIN